MVSVMEKIPPDCWDAFPLFQVLNDYLITEGIFLTFNRIVDFSDFLSQIEFAF